MDHLPRSEEFLNRYKYPILLLILGLVLITGSVFFPSLISKIQPKASSSVTYPKESLVDKSQLFFKVDVSGQVTKPGVYALTQESRVEDAIKAAGGVTQRADKLFLTKTINLAQKVSDGMKVYIPSEGENSAPVSGASSYNGSNSAVNINQADMSSLDKLPGIGQITAQKIIDNRPYSTIDDLLIKKVVSKSVFTNIKDKIATF